MKRIILHWTAGGYTPNGLDKRHYHFLIDGDGKVVDGNNPPEANARIASPTDGSTYAPHTRQMNTGSIGVAVAAMRGAVERPFDRGPSPIKPVQVEALVRLVADLAREYDIPVTRETILSHAEVQKTLGVRQRGKWDITWLPHMIAPGDPVQVGDYLRRRVFDALTPAPAPVAEVPEHKQSFISILIRAILGLFKGGRS